MADLMIWIILTATIALILGILIGHLDREQRRTHDELDHQIRLTIDALKRAGRINSDT